MKGKNKKKIIILAIISIILMIIMLYFYFPKSVKLEGKTVEWQNNNSEYLSSRDVKIVGYVHNYIFKDDNFSGNIYIEGVCDFKYISRPVDFDKDYVFMSNLLINNASEPNIGFIIFSRDFSSFSVFLTKDPEANTWSSENSIVLSYPVADREEAVKLTDSLASKDKWLSNGSWK